MSVSPARIACVAALSATLCLGASVSPARAFTACATAQLDARGSQLPMEGSDPVAIGAHVFMAYSSGNQVVFMSSADYGATFIAQQINGSDEQMPSRPRIAAAGARVYVTWLTTENALSQTFVRRSTDYGLTFGPTVSLGPADLRNSPQIAASGLGVTIAYVSAGSQTVIASSADGGDTWPTQWRHGIQGETSEEVSVGRLGVQIVAGWSEYLGSERFSYIGVSHDGGVSFRVSDLSANSRGARERLIAVSSKTGIWYIYAMDYFDAPPGNTLANGVLFTSLDGGVSWQEQTISENSHQGEILVDASTVYLTWLQLLPDGNHVYLGYSSDNGLTWQAPLDLSEGPIGAPARDEVYLADMSVVGQRFSVAYTSQGAVSARSMTAISKSLSKPVVLGPGSNAMIGGGSVLWLGPGVGQGQPVFYGHCTG